MGRLLSCGSVVRWRTSDSAMWEYSLVRSVQARGDGTQTMDDHNEDLTAVGEALPPDGAEARLELMRAVFNALPMSIGIIDATGKVLELSAGTEELWGGSPRPDDVDAYGVYRAFHPETGERLRPEEWATARALASGEAVVDQVVEIERFDAERRTVLGSTTPLRSPAGTLLGWVGVNSDITELAEARRQAQRETLFVRATLDAMQSALIVVSSVRDASGRVVDFVYSEANRRALEFFHASRHDIIGHRMLEVHPALRDTGLFGRYVAALEQGEPLVIDAWAQARTVEGGKIHYHAIHAEPFEDGLVVVWTDVTDKRAQSEALKESEERFRLAMQKSAVGMCIVSPDGHFLEVNPALREILQRSEDELISSTWQTLTHSEDLDVDTDLVRRVLDGEIDSYRLLKRFLSPGGEVIWGDLSVACVRDDSGKARYFISQILDLTERVRMEHELEQRTRFDELTGLLNWREAQSIVDGGKWKERQGSETYAVLFCDVDNFKAVNDSVGHLAADEILREVSRRIRDCIRKEDLAARYGGDEMMVVLPGVHDLKEASVIAEKIRAAAAEPLNLEQEVPVATVTLSLGIALAQPDESFGDVVIRADNAMYRAKNSGRNRIAFIE